MGTVFEFLQYRSKLIVKNSQKAQPCYCGESVCTGFIGGATKSQGIVDELLADEEIEEEDDPDTCKIFVQTGYQYMTLIL